MFPLDPAKVSAVLVTRGNCDLAPILESLIFEDVVVWDNSREDRDEMTWGRTLAIGRAKHQFIYSQDDDIIHSRANQRAILDAYYPRCMTGCMWAEWSDGARRQGIEDGYDDLVFAGSGSVYDRALPGAAAQRYLDHFPHDDFFRLWADTIIGVIAASQQLDLRFEVLPVADAPYRMCNQVDAEVAKAEAIRRARWVRDRDKITATRRAA